MTDPIIVVSLPRSGSSMVAGAMAQHGVWVGTCQEGDAGNAKGYYENRPIADLIGRTSGHLVHKGTPAPEIPGWRELVEGVVRADGYEGGPWLWKGSAMYAPLWHEFDPVWVVVRRDIQAVKDSGRACGRYRANPTSLNAHLTMMDWLVKKRGAIEVESDELVAGNYTPIAEVLARVGIEIDEEVMDEWVDPELWRHG